MSYGGTHRVDEEAPSAGRRCGPLGTGPRRHGSGSLNRSWVCLLAKP